MSEALDRADSLKPGHGRLNLFATADAQFLGGVLDYAHRISPAWSAFAQGWAGWQNTSTAWRPDAGVLAGLRWQW